MLNRLWNNIKEWVLGTARTFRREFGLVLSSPGAMLFFFGLPLSYPVVYALIYNTEVVRDIPVAVVDNCRTAGSRQFIRHLDATPSMQVYGYATNMDDAKEWWKEKKVFAVVEIPSDYTRKVGRADQGVIQFYCDVSLLLRYRTMLENLTALQMETDSYYRQIALNTFGITMNEEQSSIKAATNFLGDTQQGFASFIMPGIVVLILQQSMVLGICFLAGGSNDRRRLHGGMDPLAVRAAPSATVIGKSLCYVALYAPMTFYVLHFIPLMFAFPHEGSMLDYILFIVPLLVASSMMGQAMQIFVSERESAFIVVVFTSVLFLFLSGLTWPRYAMPGFWKIISSCVPCTWGVNGFILINNNNATLAEQSTAYHALWWLSLAYFIIAYFIVRYKNRTMNRMAN